jgi:hypothetical protein
VRAFLAEAAGQRERAAGAVAALRGETAERGFSMALGRLFDPRDSGALVVVARNAAGRPLGFLQPAPPAPMPDRK